MPAAGLAKSKVSVSQAFATVVVASVSQLLLPSAASSTFSRIWTPTVGDHTRTVMVLAVAVNGIGAIELFGAVLTVTPAHSSAVADLVTSATWFAPPAGSATTLAASAPPKPVSVYVTAGSSNVIGSPGSTTVVVL